MVGLFSKGTAGVAGAALAVASLLLAMIVPALPTRTAEAAVPTLVTVFVSQTLTGTTVNDGVSAVNILVDIDDSSGALGASVTDETLVSVTTSLGIFTTNGLNSVTTGCAIDDAGAGAGTVVAALGAGVGQIPAGTFVSNGGASSALAIIAVGIAPSTTPEAESGTELVTDAASPATAALAEGCLGIDSVTIGGIVSNSQGVASIVATAVNGGSKGAAIARFLPQQGTSARLILTNIEGATFINGGVTGSYQSPNDEVSFSATLRDSNNNNVVGTNVQWETDDASTDSGGRINILGDGTCGSANPLVDIEITGATGSSTIDWCARSASTKGEHTLTAREASQSLVQTAKVTFSDVPAKVVLAANIATAASLNSSATAVVINAVATVTDKDARNVADGTPIAFVPSGSETGGGCAWTGTAANPGQTGPLVPTGGSATIAGKATCVVVTNVSQATDVAIAATTQSSGGSLITDGRVVNIPGSATPVGTTPAGTATPAPTALVITPNSPYQAGANAVVVQGAGTAAAVSTSIATSSARTLLALWVLTGGQYVYYLPANPQIAGGLSNFPGPVASAIAVLG